MQRSLVAEDDDDDGRPKALDAVLLFRYANSAPKLRSSDIIVDLKLKCWTEISSAAKILNAIMFN